MRGAVFGERLVTSARGKAAPVQTHATPEACFLTAHWYCYIPNGEKAQSIVRPGWAFFTLLKRSRVEPTTFEETKCAACVAQSPLARQPEQQRLGFQTAET